MNPITHLLYVPNHGDTPNTMSVINGSTNKLTKEDFISNKFHISANPHAIAVNKNTNIIYMTNESGNGVYVINGSTNHVSSVIPYKSKFRNGFTIGTAAR